MRKSLLRQVILVSELSRTLFFAERYTKLPMGFDSSMLLLAIPTHFEDLPNVFISYDTEQADGEYYKISECGKCWLLLLRARYTSTLFTSVRKRGVCDDPYWPARVGQFIDCKIIGENHD